MKNVALIGGATGLVGKHLTDLLIRDEDFVSVIVLVRKNITVESSKVRQIVFDYEKDDIPDLPEVTDVFCCLGTTMKKAGSKEAFYKVDHDFVIKLAHMGMRNKTEGFYLVSSLGASADSSNYYLKVKGKTEEDIKEMGILKLGIFRPSIIMGERDEKRVGEKIGKVIANFLEPIMLGPLKKYRGVHALDIAGSMVRFCKNGPHGVTVISSEEMRKK